MFFIYSTIPLYTPSPAQIKPVEVIEKLGDLSKIDISDAVTKLLSSISQSGSLPTASQNTPSTSTAVPRDPRQGAQQQQQQNTNEDSTKSAVINDPRRARILSLDSPTGQKTERLSIYEQGGLSVAEINKDVDLRIAEKDLDLRGGFGDTDLRSSKYCLFVLQLCSLELL